jgi:hypothetical protein
VSCDEKSKAAVVGLEVLMLEKIGSVSRSISTSSLRAYLCTTYLKCIRLTPASLTAAAPTNAFEICIEVAQHASL